MFKPQNCSEAGQRSRRFEGTKPTIENYTYLKSSLLDYGLMDDIRNYVTIGKMAVLVWDQ